MNSKIFGFIVGLLIFIAPFALAYLAYKTSFAAGLSVILVLGFACICVLAGNRAYLWHKGRKS